MMGRLFTRNDGFGTDVAVPAADHLRDLFGDTPLRVLTGDYTLKAEDNTAVFYYEGAGALTLTVPSTLTQGFGCGIIQWGVGAVTTTAGAGATRRGSGTGTSQYVASNLMVGKNSDGKSAEFVVL